MNQQFLLPPSLEELIPANHQVWLIDATIEQMKIAPPLLFIPGKNQGQGQNIHKKIRVINEKTLKDNCQLI
jgi:hypothetical protein